MPTPEQRLTLLETQVKELKVDLVALRNTLLDWREKALAWQSGLDERLAMGARQAEVQRRKERRRK